MTIPDLTPAPTTSSEPVTDEAARFTPPLRWGQSWQWPAGFAAAGIVLFFVYLHIALRHGFGADGAAQELQAWDMLNGNLVMRGWTFSDVSFYTIEMPEIAVLEWLHGGVAPDVLSVAEALNLTVLVLLVAFLAKGRATGREGLVRALVAGGIVCAPVAGSNSTILLSNPDHLATQIVVLAAWLIVDRARPRWWVPVAVAAVLAWARISDSMVLLEAELPLMVVCAARIYQRGGALRDQWYELSLGAAAIAAELLAQLILVMIRAMGGFTVFPLRESFVPVSQLSSHVWVTVESTLLLYGADFSGLPLKGNLALLTVAAHLIGVALVVAGTVHALRRFSSNDLMPQIVTAMLVASVLAYTLLSQGVTVNGGAHDLLPVLPAGAFLAGRLAFGGAAVPRRLLAVVAAGLALYALLLAHYAVRAPAAPTQKPLAAWLVDHNLRFGLSNYYSAALLSVDGNNQVTIAPVKRIGGRLVLSPWESTTSWYDPAQHDATFFVADPVDGCPADDESLWAGAAIRTYGTPAQTYSVDGSQVLVWNHNLLDTQLRQLPKARPSSC